MSRASASTCLSGIVVTTSADQFNQVELRLAALPGVEVRQRDPAASRFVVVQEAATIDGEIDGMRAIQSLPGVVDASLVVHYFGDDADA
jgi:nitrate reductase NapD